MTPLITWSFTTGLSYFSCIVDKDGIIHSVIKTTVVKVRLRLQSCEGSLMQCHCMSVTARYKLISIGLEFKIERSLASSCVAETKAKTSNHQAKTSGKRSFSL